MQKRKMGTKGQTETRVCKYFVNCCLNAGRNPFIPLIKGQASTPQITDFHGLGNTLYRKLTVSYPIEVPQANSLCYIRSGLFSFLVCVQFSTRILTSQIQEPYGELNDPVHTIRVI